jgi:anti-sigma B factor antagonist
MKRVQANVNVTERQGLLTAQISGEIDLANAGEVLGQLERAVPNAALGLIVDLSDIEYLDSKGVHMLLQLEERLRTHGQFLRVVMPEISPIRRILRLAHLEEEVPIDNTLDESIAAARAAR